VGHDLRKDLRGFGCALKGFRHSPMTTRLLRFRVLKKEYWSSLLVFSLVGLFAVRYLATWPVLLWYPGEENHSLGIVMAETVHLRSGVAICVPSAGMSISRRRSRRTSTSPSACARWSAWP
jgi:hypothetical protein